MNIENNLQSMGIILPEPNPVAGNYAATVIHNGLLLISGQTCKANNKLVHVGGLSVEEDIAKGIEAARICALNLLAQVKHACDGNWERVEKCLKLTVFVYSDSSFTSHPLVANGASDLIVQVLGEKGIHTRSAVGVSSLPGGSSVEVDGLFAVRI